MKQLEDILEKIRPAIARDGGNVELVGYNAKTGIVEIALAGACEHCPISDVTLKHFIEVEIKNVMPEVKEVRAV